MRTSFAALLAAAALAIPGGRTAGAFDRLSWPDGRSVRVVQANPQVDLASLRSGVRGEATDRRFGTSEAMFLANEMYLSGTEFFLHASERKLPIGHDRQFSFLTNVEAYWYSRYNLISLSTRSRAGIGLIHGPYLDLLARASAHLNSFGRVRGEPIPSNKDILLTKVVGSFLARSGLPQKFDNAVPMMLEFESGDPHFTRSVDTEIDATGRSRYLNDYESLRWSHGKMSKSIDLGGVGQAMLKKILWAKFFLRRNHTDQDFPGEVFLGNNAEDGFRGSVLTLGAVSTMIMAKVALFCDPAEHTLHFSPILWSPRLVGIDPTRYDPASGLRYLPHKIRPTLIYMSDMPVRQYDFAIEEPESRLWDQASWLWATAEFFDFANPRRKDNWDQVFGYQTPYDGSVMEQKYALLARGLANTVLANLDAMHTVAGVWVSSWSPDGGPGSELALADLSLAMVALARYAEALDLEPERQQHARELVRRHADFLIRVAATDGSYHERYRVADGSPDGKRDMTSQAFAIRALLAAYHLFDEERFLAAARKTARTWNREFWDEAAWLYRNQPGSDHVAYTPVDVAAVLAALRELTLVDGDAALIERFERFFVQAVDASGLMQSEDIYTGEDLAQVRSGARDSDGDGIPFLSRSDGRHGVDSVFAARVEFDLQANPVLAPAAQAPPPRPTTGEAIFAANCAVCHGPNGVGNEGPSLVGNQFVQLTGPGTVIETVTNGRISVGMPAWGGVLSAPEIERVVAHIRGLRAHEDEGAASAGSAAEDGGH